MPAHRALLLSLVALAGLSSLGGSCKSQPILSILSPDDGAAIEDCSVPVRVQLGGVADPATLDVELNGAPLSLAQSSGDPALYETQVPADFPLLAANTLVVSVQGVNGTSKVRARNFDFSAAEPRARRITDPADLITGPQASSRIGDWLLENCTARFIIQDAPQRDLTGIGEFGGNLIDAELRDRPGRDNYFEIQPMLNIESVVNADSVVIVNDGTDGSPAVIRSCGPDDVLDYINANTLVDDLLGPGSFPASADDVDLPVEACTEYRLARHNRFIEMTTTVTNLDPSNDQCMYVGDYLNPSGELEQWTSEPGTINPFGVTSGIGEMTVTLGLGVFESFGFGEAQGVDYTYLPITLPPPGCVEGVNPVPSTSFTQTGVSAVLHSTGVITTLFFGFPPVFSVPAGGSSSFTRFFAVGDGSAGNGVDLDILVRGDDAGTLSGCVTVGGVPAPGARVAVGALMSGEIERMVSHWVTDEDGCYSGQVRNGTYGVAAAKRGVPYENPASTSPVYHEVTITTGAQVTQDIALPPTGHVQVSVVDELGDPVPARVSVVGDDPSPEVTFPAAIAVLTLNTSTFQDSFIDPLPEGLTWDAYTEADGTVEFDLEPGTYDIVVSRGSEYSAYTAAGVVVPAAPAPPVQIAAQIAKVVETPGFVSSDFHLHLLPSSDSQISARKKVRAYAGEGVDNMVVTDHDRHTDLLPVIAATGFTPFIHSTVGEEITTFDYGHYNAYPLGTDPDRVTFGSTDWAAPAAVGAGFPSSSPPAYTRLPGEIYQEVFDTQRVAGGLLNTSPNLAVQINHIDSHFSPLKIDTADLPVRSHLSAAEKAARRFDPATPDADFFHVFDALELWNGYTRGQQGEFLDDRIGIWANLLNQGIKISAIYDTDSHDYYSTRQGGARSWTPASTDAPAAIDDEEIGAAVKAGKVVGGQGIYVQARLVATNAPASQADFSLAGQTQISVPDGEVTLEIDVQAPTWAPYDTIEVYANPATVVTGSNGGVPVLYSVCPTEVLQSFGGDFDVDTVNVFPSVPGAERLETSLSRSFSLAQDTWFAVVVKGTDANSASMFPEMPASRSQNGGMRALGATNALYADVDGNGSFDGPGVQVVGTCP